MNLPGLNKNTQFSLFNFAYWVIFQIFCRLQIFFKISFFPKYSLRNKIRVSNSLYADQTRKNIRPDLGPNCLQI